MGFTVRRPFSQYVRRNVKPLDYNTAYTWMFWMRPTFDQSVSDFQSICEIADSGDHANYDLVYRDFSTGGPPYLAGAGSAATNYKLLNGVWYHIALVRTSTTSRTIYINGVARATETGNVGSRPAVSTMCIGSDRYSGAFYANATFEDSREWQRALSAKEIQQEMASPFQPASQTSLWAWHPFRTDFNDRIRGAHYKGINAPKLGDFRLGSDLVYLSPSATLAAPTSTATKLSRTAFGPFWFNGTSTANAQTTSSFTPTSNSLLVVAISAVDQNDLGQKIGTNLTLTDSLNSTWTKRVQGTDAARYGTATVIWTTPITTGASMTLTFDCGAVTVHSALVSVYCYTGYNKNAPVGATADGSDEAGVGAFSMNLTAVPAASSEVLAIGATCQNSSGTYGPTTGSGWTQINLQGNLGWIGTQVQYRGGSESTLVSWVDMSGTNYGAGVDNPYCFQAVAIEIKEANDSNMMLVFM